MEIADLLAQLEQTYNNASDKEELLNKIREFIHTKLSTHNQPIDYVRWIPIEKVVANNYNPNSVAKNEMRLLYTSIKHDGYTQPVVTIYDEKQDMYVIVDGFHRYLTMKNNKDIRELNNGLLPCVVINKDINDRMASTIRHNRARGKHSVTGMSSMVFDMLQNGWSDDQICNEIGLEPDELVRLKHITGFSKLFENVEYRQAWITKNQIKIKKDYEQSNS